MFGFVYSRHPPKSQEEWMNLLQQQQSLHETEMDKWKEILTVSIDLVDQVILPLKFWNEPRREKASNLDYKQVRCKPSCTSIEAG